ncbi:4-hydroxy-tetrahydrodipicolinate reductase [Roseiterribacter gracilis]|uniref:4-hydroxy-tetrahydrodipicolinate reductase n=1 Tax=Roseiterribacter gracilis TaxID=2812848 RepID=UPI003B42E2FB
MRIAVLGAGGRMGRALIRTIEATNGAVLAGASDRAGSEVIGQDAGVLAGARAANVKIVDDVAAAFAQADVAIDFTAPGALDAHLAAARATKTALVIGTTGLQAPQESAIAAFAKDFPVIRSANYSVGVTLLRALVRQAATVLGPDYDAEIVEMHHNAKVDAPSGTALALGRAVAAGRNVQLENVWVKERDGHTGAREPGTIGFATLRGGDVAGDHTVYFAAAGERLELGHRATSREVFATGAVRAALWVAKQKPGLYDMDDVLGLT